MSDLLRRENLLMLAKATPWLAYYQDVKNHVMTLCTLASYIATYVMYGNTINSYIITWYNNTNSLIPQLNVSWFVRLLIQFPTVAS